MRWNAVPFLFLTPILALGILLNNYYKSPENSTIWLGLFLVIFSLFYFLSKRLFKSKLRYALTLILGISFLSLGYLISQFSWHKSKPSISKSTINTVSSFTVRIDSKPEKTTNTTRYEVSIKELNASGRWINTDLKAVLYARDHSEFYYGDVIIIDGQPSYLERQKNPHAFDYAQILQRKGIYLQTFCSSENYKTVGKDNSPYFNYLILSVGDFFEEILAEYISATRELDMIRAIVIGRRNEVTPEMEFAYEATGTSHILAVSGLHVGIIYVVLKLLLGFAKRKKWTWLY